MREEIKNDKFTTMKDLHSIASAFKGLQMQESLDGFFKIRECCGAHGYSNYSNIPNIIEIWSPNVTLEGDTMVMYQQTARGLVKSYRLVEQYGKKIKGIYSYLNESEQYVKAQNVEVKFVESDDLLNLLKIATILSIHRVSTLLPEIDDEINYDIAWNKTYQIDIISASLLNAHYLVASMFDEEIKIKELSEPLKKVLNKMLRVYLCDVIIKYGQELMVSGFLKGDQLLEIKDYQADLIKEVRPHAYKLTHSFILNDVILHSKLSMRHGKIYEELYNTASNSKLNVSPSLDAVDLHLKPLGKKLLKLAKL